MCLSSELVIFVEYGFRSLLWQIRVRVWGGVGWGGVGWGGMGWGGVDYCFNGVLLWGVMNDCGMLCFSRFIPFS